MTGSSDATAPDAGDEVTTADDPTKAILSESDLHKKSLCDYVINVATGCRHGCAFCYVPVTPNIRARPGMLADEADVDDPQREWGGYVLYRDDLPDRLDDHLPRRETWRETDRGRGVVGISFHTDCYMDGRAGKITRGVVETLADHGRHARILTRNPILALQDVDVFDRAASDELVTVGSSIPTLDVDHAGAIERAAPAPHHRLRGLREFRQAGVPVYVSLSPTYPTQDRADLRRVLEAVADVDPTVVFHEPINPRGANFQMTVDAAHEAGETDLAAALGALRSRDRWRDYAVRQLRWVQELGTELDLPVHLWPDEQLVGETSGATAEWLRAWRRRASPEPFAGRDGPDGPPPALPPPADGQQARLGGGWS